MSKRATQITPCLGVLMPVFNEACTINSILEKVLKQPAVKEVVVVDDDSTDGSWECLQKWTRSDNRVRAIRHEKNRGKGSALRTALSHAQAPVLIIQDADLEYNPEDYAKLLDPILRGHTRVVYGSRFAAGRVFCVKWHFLGNHMLTAMSNLITGQQLTDEATCYKMFRREVLTGLNLQEDGFGFCPEVTVKLARAKVSITEVPICYHARTRAEGKKLRLWHGLEAIYCLLKYRLARKASFQQESRPEINAS